MVYRHPLSSIQHPLEDLGIQTLFLLMDRSFFNFAHLRRRIIQYFHPTLPYKLIPKNNNWDLLKVFFYLFFPWGNHHETTIWENMFLFFQTNSSKSKKRRFYFLVKDMFREVAEKSGQFSYSRISSPVAMQGKRKGRGPNHHSFSCKSSFNKKNTHKTVKVVPYQL